MEASNVYYTDFRCPVGTSLPEKLRRLCIAAGIKDIDMDGKFVAIKMHFGELGNLAYLRPNYAKAVADLCKEQGGLPFLTDCNTLYPGSRKNALEHLTCAQLNGFWPMTTGCQVLIADGLRGTDEVEVPVPGGEYCKTAKIGRAIMDADVFISLTHFKGHVMGGFGGSLKNIAIGCASGKTGKAQLHSDGTNLWAGGPLFMERMVEGGKAITTHFKGHMAYINVLRRMSVDCDCAGTSAAEPTAPDIGILASTDLLAVDQASVDMVYALPEQQRRDLVERIESRSGLRQLEYMETLGMGHARYDLVSLS